MSGGLDANQLGSYDDIWCVKDIKGYWNMSNDGEFNEQDTWEGQIVLYEDYWFEGLVKDKGKSGEIYPNERFVFGVYFPYRGIELLKVTPSKVSDPFVFRGKKDNKGYSGEFSVIGLFGEEKLGISQITTKDPKLYNAQELEARIDEWKKSMIGDENSFLYDNTVQMRTEMIDILSAQYEGRKFETGEMEEILKECEPVNETVRSQTRGAVKKMLKKFDIEIEEDDVDLPF